MEGEWTREEVTMEGKYSEQGRYSERQGDSDGMREDEEKGIKDKGGGSYVGSGYPLRQPFISDFPVVLYQW